MDIHGVLEAYHSGSQYKMDGDNYDGLEWLDEKKPKPTEAELIAQFDELESRRREQKIDREADEEIERQLPTRKVLLMQARLINILLREAVSRGFAPTKDEADLIDQGRQMLQMAEIRRAKAERDKRKK